MPNPQSETRHNPYRRRSTQAHDNEVILEEFEKSLLNLRKLVESKFHISKIFKSIHQMLNQGASHEKILDSLFSSLELVIPYDRMGVSLIEDEGRNLRIQWVKSKIPVKFITRDYTIPVNELSQEIPLNSGEAVIYNDLEQYLADHPDSIPTKHALQDGIKAGLVCPLIVDGEAIGVLIFSSCTPNIYTNAHKEIFYEIEDGISLIIDQSLMKQSISENALKEKMFRETIHDLNNPLSVIKGTLDMIERKDWYKQLSDDSKRYFKALRRNCDSMTIPIKNIVYFNESNIPNIRKKEIQLDQFISDLVSDGVAMTNKKNMSFMLKKDHELTETAYLDELNIKLAIGNLIANAVKYSQNETRVILEITYDGVNKKIFFFVHDQGPGIPEEELSKLYTEYGTTSAVPTGGEEKLGLGLANVKRIVLAHEGQVLVKSKIGKGSTFGFWIPAYSNHS